MILSVDKLLTNNIRVIHILTIKNYKQSINKHLNKYPHNLLIEKSKEKEYIIKLKNKKILI
jgi:hypothetical protein